MSLLEKSKLLIYFWRFLNIVYNHAQRNSQQNGCLVEEFDLILYIFTPL